MNYLGRANRRRWSPIWGAFTTTTLSAAFLIAGSAGYHLDKRDRFFASAWSDTVIWWEVGAGAALIPVALYFWRRGAAEIDRRLATDSKDSHRLSTD